MPSSFHAPSAWFAAIAPPQRKPAGNLSIVILSIPTVGRQRAQKNPSRPTEWPNSGFAR
ncbi:hypothetical protein KL86PLE_40156 [uncultured Pleomorphomonas sp.]|uniref:Uncharacterized protein n=1 Tax=uncultured Pleomorphomonas sp. TaxID=442121 RepID=A0A212LFU8_9HYPH|nr:hypothetical protein KL86PLE_40156 [uncultured Pleomorphomonas sp.]